MAEIEFSRAPIVVAQAPMANLIVTSNGVVIEATRDGEKCRIGITAEAARDLGCQLIVAAASNRT